MIQSIKNERIKKVTNINDKYTFVKKIGEGGQGFVKLARHKIARSYCAIKFIEMEKINKQKIRLQLLKKELRVIQEINHPLLMQTMETLYDETFIYLVSEYVKFGSL